MSENSWAWNHFYTDGQRQGNNKDTKRAWCKACLDVEIATLRQSDILATAGGILRNRTEEELYIAGETITICDNRGIYDVLHLHYKLRMRRSRSQASQNNISSLISFDARR
jgi:hypothetical protein